MRLNPRHIEIIKQLAAEQFGERASLRVFGSRLDDTARGGDIDLLVEVPDPVERPAWQASSLSARVSRALNGRRVDVVLAAPNLAELPIHRLARNQGLRL